MRSERTARVTPFELSARAVAAGPTLREFKTGACGRRREPSAANEGRSPVATGSAKVLLSHQPRHCLAHELPKAAIPAPYARFIRGKLPIRFTPDGRSLYVRTTERIPVRIWQLDLASDRKTAWLEIAPLDPSGVLALDIVLLSADGKSDADSYYRILSGLHTVDGLAQ